jgi:argininosuccinate lyase
LRDLHRLELAEGEALSYLPLGSAALSGTTLPINLSALADDLGFSAVSTNSIDAVSDRDFLLVQLQAFALLGVHISRLAEDLILWASPQFGFLQISSAWSTGSSIMPNKRNPDVLELARAKSARLIGIANSALVLMKGLPSAYNSDLHELKRDFIQANRELSGLLPILSQFIEAMGFSSERAELSLGHGHLLATEIANHLTDQGENFRDAYRQTAALVELAEARGFQVHEILPSEALALAPRLDVKFFAALNFESAVEARKNMGGTSLASLEATIQGILSAIK